MPTFTSIDLDRLLEPGATRTMPSDPKFVPRPKLNRRNSVNALPSTERPVSERKYHWTQITPALYTTPETTPLPDSPSSFPPSPYIINHKRRGPRLLKSHSVASVSTPRQTQTPGKVDDNGIVSGGISDASKVTNGASVSATPVVSSTEGCMSSLVSGRADDIKVPENDSCGEKKGVNDVSKGMITVDFKGFHARHITNGEASDNMAAENGVSKSPSLSPVRDGSDGFVDPQESLSFSSSYEVEDSVKLQTPGAEFFDAWEELSSEGGGAQPSRDLESELREMRLGLLMEMERRKQADDVVKNMHMAWERIGEELSQVGIVLPLCLTLADDGKHSSSYHTEDICQQIHVARFVSQSIGSALAKAEAQVELEAQLEAKNFEIARLWDRLNYYETVNREMSQRNQESIELARRLRQKRKIKKRWVWGSISAAVTIGAVGLAWAYFPRSRGSESFSTDHVETHANNAAEN